MTRSTLHLEKYDIPFEYDIPFGRAKILVSTEWSEFEQAVGPSLGFHACLGAGDNFQISRYKIFSYHGQNPPKPEVSCSPVSPTGLMYAGACMILSMKYRSFPE